MVTGNYHYIAATGRRHFAEKSVIQFLRMVTGRAGIKNISGNQQRIDTLGLYEFCQPV
jgi:hypothetical protein